MITKEKKKEIVAKLTKALKDAKSVVFVAFKGLSVADSSALRRALRAEGVGYTVARKTLIKRVLEAEKPTGEMPELLGEIALAFGEDSLASAREVYSFQKKLDGKVSIIGGIFEGGYRSKEAMLEIAMIPPLQVLRGMFVQLINSPIQRMAISLNEIAKLKD